MNMRPDRDDAGNFTDAISLDSVLDVFDDVEGPVVTSGDVAEALKCSRETARRKLGTLENQGRVASRKTGGRSVWWIVDSTEGPNGINQDDPFWDVEPGGSGETDVSERVDDILYGES